MGRKNLYILLATICMVIGFTSCALTACALDGVYTNTDDIADIIRTLQPRVIEISNISIKKQPNAYTCGITTVTVVSNYFNHTGFEVNDLIRKYNASNGSTVNDIKKWLAGELPGRVIVHESNRSNEEMIRNIHASLNANNPVVIFFGSPNPYNKPYYDFHGSVVYGIDLDSQTVTIANSYGYEEKTSLVDFINRMSYSEINKYPPVQQFQIRRNRMDRNTYFLIK